VNLEKVREAAERVARSAGLESWMSNGRSVSSRFLRVYNRPVAAGEARGGGCGRNAAGPLPQD